MVEDIAAALRRVADIHISEYDSGDIERRGSRLRRNRQRSAVAMAATLVLVVSLSSIAAVRVWHGQRQPTATGSGVTSPSATADAPRRFIPTTSIEDGHAVMPVTFLDGTTAELVYPSDLALAEMGAVPYGSGELNDPPLHCCARDFAFSFDEPFPAGEVLKEYPGADGHAVRLRQGRANGPNYLVFEIGRWRLGVWDSAGGATMSDKLRGLWSAYLRGRVSSDGFPVLTATGPLRLAGAGDAYGPSLEFSVLDGNSVAFRPVPGCPAGYVEPSVEDLSTSPLTVVLCRPEWSMVVNVTGDRAFVLRVIETLSIRNVRLAGG